MKTPNPNPQPSTDRPSDTGPTAETAAPSTAAARTAARLAPLVAWADRNPVPGTTLRIVRQLLAVDVRDRVFGMAGQSFLAVIPLLIISSSWLSQSDGRALATALNPRLGRPGVTADTVTLLFSRPEGSAEVSTASGLSLALLFFSVNSFTRTLRRSIEGPWELPKVGWKGQLSGLLGVVLLIVMQVTLAVIAVEWVSTSAAQGFLEGLVRTVVATAFWIAIGRALTHGRLSVARLWPGALVGGVGSTALAIWTVPVLPGLLERECPRHRGIDLGAGRRERGAPRGEERQIEGESHEHTGEAGRAPEADLRDQVRHAASRRLIDERLAAASAIPERATA